MTSQLNVPRENHLRSRRLLSTRYFSQVGMRPLLLLRLVTQVSVLLLQIGNAGECFVTICRLHR